MKILVIDVGGTHIKILATGHKKRIELSSGPKMTPAKMLTAVRKATAGWKYNAVSIGYPGRWCTAAPSWNPVILDPAGYRMTSARRSAGQQKLSMTRRCRPWEAIKGGGCFSLVWYRTWLGDDRR